MRSQVLYRAAQGQSLIDERVWSCTLSAASSNGCTPSMTNPAEGSNSVNQQYNPQGALLQHHSKRGAAK